MAIAKVDTQTSAANTAVKVKRFAGETARKEIVVVIIVTVYARNGKKSSIFQCDDCVFYKNFQERGGRIHSPVAALWNMTKNFRASKNGLAGTVEQISAISCGGVSCLAASA